jgi:hypothetical protein
VVGRSPRSISSRIITSKSHYRQRRYTPSVRSFFLGGGDGTPGTRIERDCFTIFFEYLSALLDRSRPGKEPVLVIICMKIW